MSPFPFPTLKIIFIIFFPFRLSSAHNLTAQQINRALEDIPFDSDNSDMYEVPTPSTGPVQPLQQRSHPSTKAKVWEWQKRNLSSKHLPASSVRPRNVQHCRSEVQLFLEMLLADNLELVTIHGQICVLNDVSIFRQGIFVKTAGQILKSI